MTTFTTYDGRTVYIRHINQDDAAKLVDMFYRSSEHTQRMRFQCGCSKCPNELVSREAAKLCHLDPECQVALVACVNKNNEDQIVGIARLGRATPNDAIAETGIIIQDDFQGIGLGTYLLRQLVEVARPMGITSFSAWVLPENRKILYILKKMGQPSKQIEKHGEIYIEISLEEVKLLHKC